MTLRNLGTIPVSATSVFLCLFFNAKNESRCISVSRRRSAPYISRISRSLRSQSRRRCIICLAWGLADRFFKAVPRHRGQSVPDRPHSVALPPHVGLSRELYLPAPQDARPAARKDPADRIGAVTGRILTFVFARISATREGARRVIYFRPTRPGLISTAGGVATLPSDMRKLAR